MSEILITGATGTVGGDLVKVFERENVPVAATITGYTKSGKSFGDNVERRVLNFNQPDTFQTALRNIRKVFLLFPPGVGSLRKTVFPFVEACRFAEVEQIVLLSVQGAEKSSFLPHRKIEREILRQDIPYTFLRPSYFNQNFLTAHKDDVRSRNEIFVPAGKGRTAFVDTRDVAEVAFRALREPKHLNQAYELTGREALDYFEIAEILSRVLGKDVVYKNPNLLWFVVRESLRRKQIGFVLVMAMLYTSARLGRAAHLTDDLERILERAPVSFEQFAEDYQDVWL